MQQELLEKTLERIGLTPSESKIYLALLKYGELKTGEILKRTNINSGRIYDILTNLESKGFISKTTKNTVKYFKAAPPHIIQQHLESRAQELAEEQKSITQQLPDFEKLYKSHEHDVGVEIYIGKKGMRTAYEILFAQAAKHKDYYVIGITQQKRYADWLPLFLETYVYPTRKRLKCKVRKIINQEARHESLWKKDDSEIRYLPLTMLTSYDILGDIVIVQIFQGETINIIIKNKQTADDFREQFNLLWKIAKK